MIFEESKGGGQSEGLEVKLVRAAIFARRIREDSFPTGLFGEPAWDFLLELYLALLEERTVTLTDILVPATVSPTVARRWFDVLCEKTLVVLLAHADERGREWVELSAKGEALMRGYFGPGPALWNGW